MVNCPLTGTFTTYVYQNTEVSKNEVAVDPLVALVQKRNYEEGRSRRGIEEPRDVGR